MCIRSERSGKRLSRVGTMKYLFGEATSGDVGGQVETGERLGARRIIKVCG